jgi:nucleoside-diphosphate-sugar epimerase
MANIGVVGAGGFLGHALCAEAERRGCTVFRYSSSDGTGIDPGTGLFASGFELDDNLDIVFYLAQSPYYRDVPKYYEHVLRVNEYSALRTAELAIRKSVPRYIYVSTGSVYKPDFMPLAENSELNRDNWYTLSKIHAEEGLSLFRNGIDLTVARLFGLYGPRQIDKVVPVLAGKITRGEPVLLERNPRNAGDLDGLKISLCYIDDAAKMLMALADKPGVVCLNIAGERPVTIRELCLEIASRLGRQADFIITDKYRNGDLVSDNTLLNRILKPAYTGLDQGIHNTVFTAS